MGISWSNRRRNNFQYPPPPYQHPSSYFYSVDNPPLLHPPPPPPPPPPQSYYYNAGYNSYNYANSSSGRFNSHPHYANEIDWWPAVRPPLPPPLPSIEHRQAKKIRNDVNVHKNTLRLEVDELKTDHHLVSFVFDALYDGSITVFYFAKEEPKCRFIPLYPEAFIPVKIPFRKGTGQKFIQPSGTGIDLGFFALEDLTKPSPEEDIFPLVISAETISQNLSTVGECLPGTSPRMQITQAVFEKSNGNTFQVKVIRQLLWIDEVRYELREIFGIGSSSTDNFDDTASGEECVICMTEPKDTAVLPCRHMCLCSECAKELKLQSNKCPICRQPIEELLEIKINNGDK